jgi:hypothetical protein
MNLIIKVDTVSFIIKRNYIGFVGLKFHVIFDFPLFRIKFWWESAKESGHSEYDKQVEG